ncbi:putative bifunctional diguanylate cyclase/phosphodiesterase [Shewanella salipaludis]|uniref:Bifunctional diguanylate cyclase/phosphodiesterase n=1 Tax=Shewanella salipaludis TaxID=2723052 RepID=A0A972G1H2_9GAMM|nr:bifunctional diguanylate cyclase/phosphodiesterase [Shewanella salipaludis]NMH66572.1 bifunctional diguanylate cyclase/phosphodiesterase [Shewanella salipaludis]
MTGQLWWLGALAGILTILLGLWLWQLLRRRRFLAELQRQLTQQQHLHLPLKISPVPAAFQPLYQSLSELLLSLPEDITRDRLTGLANRVGFKRYTCASMPLTQGALVLIDVHRFRYVNDLLGFAFGDELLRLFSQRLQHLKQAPSFISRMNGDEFLLYYDTRVDEAQLHRLKGRMQVPFDVKGTPIAIKVHIGLLDLGQHHADLSQMLRRLDLALKKARNARDGVASYGSGDDLVHQRELQLISSLPKDLQLDRLHMVYQPKLALSSGRCTQMEALIRWEHGSLGTVSPAEFIPLAEYAGMIDLVSRWALEQVLAQQAAWRQAGLTFQVALNLSTSDLDNDGLAEEIAARLEHYRLPADALVIEITESTLMTDLQRALTTLNQLRAIGVRLAIDDFGTGHSSLAYLKHLPVDEVKIDKAFLEDLLEDEQAAHIMGASISLAKKLGFEVTVEGVETKAVRDALQVMGADVIQGDFFAPPMTASELEGNWPQLQARAATKD